MDFFEFLAMQSNREGTGKNHLVIDFNKDRIVPGFLEFQSLDVVDQVDSMLGTRRFKIPVDDVPRFFFGHGNSDGNFQLVFSFGEVGKGKEPDHSGMDHWELLGSKV